MATVPQRKVGGPDGYRSTFKANGTILFGAVVMSNATANEVVATGTGTDQPIGVALYDEHKATVNAAEQYVTTDPCQIEMLSAGQVWMLKAESNIAKGDLLVPAAAGAVKKASGTGEFACFRALEAISAAARGRCLKISGRFTTTAAGE